MRIVLLASPVLLLAACAEPADPPTPERDEADTIAQPEGEDTTAPSAMTPSDTIPAAMHGRWGLVAADCTSTRGDAKGLIEVSEKEIRFYESVGRVDTASATGDAGFRASFAFTGEGMEWTRDMQLSLSDDGNTLTRSEFGEDALAEPLIYTKCA